MILFRVFYQSKCFSALQRAAITLTITLVDPYTLKSLHENSI